jgi:hypothetical protein
MSDSRHNASGGDSLEPLNVPHLAAGTFMIQTTGTEVLLILQSARSLVDKNTGAISERTVNQPIAVVSISPGTAKDLHILLGEAVARHEESFGPITTPFTARREAERSSHRQRGSAAPKRHRRSSNGKGGPSLASTSDADT